MQRRWRMLAGSAAVIAGGVGLLWPHNALRLVALVFGIYLIVVGITRVTGAASAFTPRGTPAARRTDVAQIVLGVLVVAAGVLCLNNPFGSLTALTWLIGAGWVIDGMASVLSAFSRGQRASAPGERGAGDPRDRAAWLVAVGGVVSTVAGIVLVAVPYDAVRSLLFFASVLLLVIGVVTVLVTLLRNSRMTHQLVTP